MKHPETALLLKNHREKKSLTRQTVAKKLGFSQQFYGRLEKAQVGIPHKLYGKTRKVLRIKREDLFQALASDLLNDLDKKVK